MRYTLSKFTSWFTIEFEDEITLDKTTIEHKNDDWKEILKGLEESITCDDDYCVFAIEHFATTLSHEAHIYMMDSLERNWNLPFCQYTASLDRS